MNSIGHSFPTLKKKLLSWFLPHRTSSTLPDGEKVLFKILKFDKPSVKELAQRSKQKRVRFATHASNFFPHAMLHNVVL